MKSKLRFAPLLIVLAAFVPPAFAFTAPTAGDFLYDAYDIAFNKILFGPGGWIGGGILMAIAFQLLRTAWVQSLMCLLAAAGIIKLQSLMETLGAIV